MKWAGYAQVALSKLKLPGDIKARMGMPRVMDLARSIELLGDEPINALAVEKDGLVLIAGRDRTAALMRLGAKKAWCHLAVDVTDQDRLDLEIDENLHRRQDDRDKLIARRVAKVAGELSDEMSDNSPRQPGRPKSKQTKAREVVARELDTTPEAVRAAEKRAEAEEREETAEPVVVPPPVETWGVPVEHLTQEFASVRIAQEAMRVADRHLRQAQSALAALEDGGGVCAAFHMLVYGEVHQAASRLRSFIPTALCPYCKGLAHRRERCSGCSGAGYVSDDALLGVAEELRAKGPGAVVPDGRGGFVLVVAQRSKGAKPVAPKALKILDANDNPIVVADEDFPF